MTCVAVVSLVVYGLRVSLAKEDSRGTWEVTERACSSSNSLESYPEDEIDHTRDNEYLENAHRFGLRPRRAADHCCKSPVRP